MKTIAKKRSLRAEREFGLIVGGVLLLLSLWWIYRGKFSNVSFAEALSFVTTRIILAFVFFGIVTPIGVVKRLFGWDPLHRRAAPGDSYWKPYSERQRDPRHYEKMF